MAWTTSELHTSLQTLAKLGCKCYPTTWNDMCIELHWNIRRKPNTHCAKSCWERVGNVCNCWLLVAWSLTLCCQEWWKQGKGQALVKHASMHSCLRSSQARAYGGVFHKAVQTCGKWWPFRTDGSNATDVEDVLNDPRPLEHTAGNVSGLTEQPGSQQLGATPLQLNMHFCWVGWCLFEWLLCFFWNALVCWWSICSDPDCLQEFRCCAGSCSWQIIAQPCKAFSSKCWQFRGKICWRGVFKETPNSNFGLGQALTC